MHFIVGNYGNDTLALMAWAKNNQLNQVVCIYVDTGWAAPAWEARVQEAEIWAKKLGFTPVMLKSHLDFSAMVRSRGEFPTTEFQWCASTLKGLTLLDYLEIEDPLREAIIVLPHQRRLAAKLDSLPTWVAASEYYAERKLWYPLCWHDDIEMKALLATTPFDWLESRSLECAPCVNSDARDLYQMDVEVVKKAALLEQELGEHMLDESLYQQGEDIFLAWQRLQAVASCQKGKKYLFDKGCASPFACGL